MEDVVNGFNNFLVNVGPDNKNPETTEGVDADHGIVILALFSLEQLKGMRYRYIFCQMTNQLIDELLQF